METIKATLKHFNELFSAVPIETLLSWLGELKWKGKAYYPLQLLLSSAWNNQHENCVIISLYGVPSSFSNKDTISLIDIPKLCLKYSEH